MASVSTAQLPEVISRLELPPIEVSSIDLPATVSEAAEAIGVRRSSRRPRWILALGGLMLLAAAGWGLVRRPQLRTRAQQTVRVIRDRISSLRPNAFDLDVGGSPEPVAFTAADTKPIAPDRWSDTDDPSTPDYPAGLGSDTGEDQQTTQSIR